jgi:hypothetical protein
MTDTSEILHATGVYETICYGPDGEIKWSDRSPNIVPTEGKATLLINGFSLQVNATGTFYMSLITAGTAVAGTTYASPAAITEVTSGVLASRIGVTWSAASAGSKSATTTTFPIIGTATITGNMLVYGSASYAALTGDSNIGGRLISSANFSGGSKIVSSGDSLAVTYALSV